MVGRRERCGSLGRSEGSTREHDPAVLERLVEVARRFARGGSAGKNTVFQGFSAALGL